MAECNSIECSCTECNSVETSNLDNQQFRLNKINEIKDYFTAEIKEIDLMSKRPSKYIAYFDCLTLTATSGSISIASIATVIGNTCKNSKFKP